MLIAWTLWPVAALLGLLLAFFSLEHEPSNPDAFADLTPSPIAGTQVTCITDLKPSGKVELDGIPHDAICTKGYIEKGATVTVVEKQGFNLVVETIT